MLISSSFILNMNIFYIYAMKVDFLLWCQITTTFEKMRAVLRTRVIIMPKLPRSYHPIKLFLFIIKLKKKNLLNYEQNSKCSIQSILAVWLRKFLKLWKSFWVFLYMRDNKSDDSKVKNFNLISQLYLFVTAWCTCLIFLRNDECNRTNYKDVVIIHCVQKY